MHTNIHGKVLQENDNLKHVIVDDPDNVDAIIEIINTSVNPLEFILDIDIHGYFMREISPLHLALRYGPINNYKVFFYMLSLLPDIMMTDYHQYDILSMAIIEHDEYMFNFILTNYDFTSAYLDGKFYNPDDIKARKPDTYPIVLAAKKWESAFWTLIKYGFNIDFFLKYDAQTVLSILLSRDIDYDMEKINVLIDNGVPLYNLAMFTTRLDIWTMLLDAQVDMHYRPYHHYAEEFDPLYFALKYCNFPISTIQRLLPFMKDEESVASNAYGEYAIKKYSYLVALSANEYYDTETKAIIGELLYEAGASLYLHENHDVISTIIYFYFPRNNSLLLRYLLPAIDINRIVSLVDKSRKKYVDMTIRELLTYIKKHPPTTSSYLDEKPYLLNKRNSFY